MKQLFTSSPPLPFFRPRPASPLFTRVLASLALTCLGSVPAFAQFPRVESFRNTTAPGFTLGGTPNPAVLTATTEGNGNGYLQLTSAANDQAGYAIDSNTFPTPNGFSISFEFFSYGKTTPQGADGFSVFLIDGATQNFTIGASGGSLGYAQKTIAPLSNGVSNGYIGIGIDEFGNYSNPTEGRNGGPGFTPDAVAVRGPGNGNSTTDYRYIAGSGTLPFSLDVTTNRAPSGDPDYRRAYIDVIPQTDGTYRITTRIQYGNNIRTAVNNIPVPVPFPTLRVGFAGSTGGSTNIHEIRNLEIVKAPFALDDVASTVYNAPVTLNVRSNDIFPGSVFGLGSIDLDPFTTGIQTTRIVAGQGNFAVDTNGNVTFTPSGSFAGVVTIPYTVASIAGDRSTPANITIIVTGADLATSVSGPATATPGSQIAYTTTTTNQGTETALNVIPTLQLTPSLPSGSLVLPSGASYNSTTGLVTFATVPSLAANGTPIINVVRVTVPTSGTPSITAVSNVSSSVPDPVGGNNSASVTTTVNGIANVATLCAVPGKDGAATLTNTSVPNTYFPVASGTSLTTNSSTSVTLGAAGAGTTPISVGDLLMIVQMQGATISTTNDAAYGSVTGNYTAGVYEYAIAASNVPVSGGTLMLAAPVKNSYESLDFNGTITGQRRFQVIRVPQYSSLTINGAVTGAAWNGRIGGILALDVAGRTTFGTGASLTMTAKGFRGGGGRSYTSGGVRNVYYANASNAHGSKGEGLAGTPRFTFAGGTSNTDVLDNSSEGYVSGSNAAGAPGNAGGGANNYTSVNPPGSSTTNSGNAGGGGGGNAGVGGIGGYGWGSNSTGTQAEAGRSVSNVASATRMFMGGGGGAGGSDDGTDAYSSSGAPGGGIILFRTGVVSGTASVTANGGNALPGNTTQGGGGGGAGGSVLVLASPPNGVTTTGISGLTISAIGGNGGTVNNVKKGESYGPGGGGGGGYVYTNGTVAGTPSVLGGNNGVTNDGSNGGNSIAFGATDGTAGATATNTNANIIIGGAGSCLPSLTAALATSTPTIQRSGANNSVTPATFTLTVSNTGGSVSGVRALASLPAVFGYDNTFTPQVTITLANGTTVTPTGFTLPSNGVSTPTFSGFTLPAGASLSITFRVTVASSAVNNFPYQSEATVTYDNPLRDDTPATATITPGGNYAGGTLTTLGTAGGSNYSASSSTAEDVTITRPLPVTLTGFTAVAAGQDAKLTWTTAQELNNDQFEVERSLDGVTFERIGSVKGKGTTTQATTYSYTDAKAARLSLKPIYYRLRQVDLDGSFSYSPVRTVRFERTASTSIALYPNPHSGQAVLDLTALPAGEYVVDITDLAGRHVQQLRASGTIKNPLTLTKLPLGTYIVRVHNNQVNLTLPMVRN